MSNRIPEPLKEVWKWEDEIYRETKDMNLEEYVNYIRKEARKIINKYNKVNKKLISGLTTKL